MANHSSVFAGKILWTEEPGGLQSMGLQRMDMTEATKYVAQGTQIPHVAGQLSLCPTTTEAHTPYSSCSAPREATAMRSQPLKE